MAIHPDPRKGPVDRTPPTGRLTVTPTGSDRATTTVTLVGDLEGRRVAIVGSTEHVARSVLESALAAEGAAVVELDGSPVDVVVHLPEPAGEDVALVDTDEATWDEAAEAPARAFLATVQAAHPGLAATGGRLVVVLPDAVRSGVAGRVAVTTGWGAVLALARSAGRRWAADGIRVTTVLHHGDADGPAVVDGVLLLARSSTRFDGATLEVGGGPS